MKQPSIIREKSYRFALRIISLYKAYGSKHASQPLFHQLLRSGTSIGANVEEAMGAESRADFRHKMAIAYKEARETEYWLRLLVDSNLIPESDVQTMLQHSTELVKILYAIGKTMKQT